MRKVGVKGNCTIWLSANDTYNWAHRPGAAWPGSTLSGNRVCVTIEGDDLVDFTINGKYGDCACAELYAILADFGARGSS